jgi:hypothetical protein
MHPHLVQRHCRHQTRRDANDFFGENEKFWAVVR